jgi:hypothetical protein
MHLHEILFHLIHIGVHVEQKPIKIISADENILFYCCACAGSLELVQKSVALDVQGGSGGFVYLHQMVSNRKV